MASTKTAPRTYGFGRWLPKKTVFQPALHRDREALGMAAGNGGLSNCQTEVIENKHASFGWRAI